MQKMWNSDEKFYFSKILVLTAKAYGKEIPTDLAQLIITDVEDLPFEKCLYALQVYRRDPKNKFWPKASDIREIVDPKYDHRAIANELVRKIENAVAKFGYPWEVGYFSSSGELYWLDSQNNIFKSFEEAVKSELGEIGYHVIASRGGWMNVRESVKKMDEGTFVAQMREQIIATITLRQRGIDITKLAMPRSKETEENAVLIKLGLKNS